MFFQVLASKEHKSLLCFLWWQDSDLSKKLIDHEMCVHIFGGTSPPSCSNYVLKRTSIDGEDQFWKAVTETLQDNFYVDDLLKSLDNEREAIKLIKNVKAMCGSGGFKLTKFLSNRKQVLQLIDETDRRQGVKDQPMKFTSALGNCWCDCWHDHCNLHTHWQKNVDTLFSLIWF